MKLITKILLTAFVLIGVSTALTVCDPLNLASVVSNKPSNTISVYGFYVGMSKEDFDAAQKALVAEPNQPFKKWHRIMDHEANKVVMMGLVFKADQWQEVLKHIAKENHIEFRCATDQTITYCALDDKNGNVTDIVVPFAEDADGVLWGAIVMSDAAHADPKHPVNPPESEDRTHGAFGDENPAVKKDLDCSTVKGTRPLNGHCVSDF